MIMLQQDRRIHSQDMETLFGLPTIAQQKL
jgi:hypothetical protein